MVGEKNGMNIISLLDIRILIKSQYTYNMWETYENYLKLKKLYLS